MLKTLLPLLITTISIAASTSSTTSSSTSPPLPSSSTGIQGPTGIVELSNIQASTGSLTGITGITGTSGSATAATGPHFAVYPTGATGTAAAATGPIEAQHLYDDYTKTTAEYRQKVADLQPKGSFAMQPMKYNDTIDDDVSEHRRQSRYVSYYILPKLQHMMKVPMKNELDRTRAVLYDCREDLQTLQHLKSIRENELTQSQLILSQSNNQLSNVSNQVTSILKTRNKTSTSHLYGQQSATSATSAAFTSTSTSSLKNVRFINKRTALKYEQAHAVRASLRNWSKQKEPQSMTSTLIELSQNHPLILQDMTHTLLLDHSKSNINGLQPYNEKATISFLEKSEKTFNNLLLNKPNEDCFAIATCAKRADLRATRTSNEIHVHVQKYLNTLAQARVTHRTAQCHAFYKHENDTLKRIEKLQHVINVWNETKATIVVNKPPLMNLMTTLPIPPTPTPIQKTSMPNIPVVFPPLPMLPKENKCLRICSNQGRCAWSKEKPKTENIYDGQELHSSKEISFPKEDPIQMIAVCICHDGYEGEDCGVKQCPNSCTKHGHCLDGECMCDTGYYGLSCGIQENENSPHIIRNKNVEQSLDVGLAYLHSATGGGGDSVGASGGATGTAALAASTASTASTTIDATGIDQTIGNDGDRAKIMQERLTQSNTSSIEAEHARKRSQKIMMMAEYMRLESSKNNKLEEEMQKLQDKGVVDKDALIMQRVRARQVEEAKKQKVQSILNIQEEKKKVLSRKQWSNKEYLTEKRQQINVQIEKQNINVLKHARALDEHSIQKGTILGNHILSLVSDMCIRNSWNDFISPKLKPRNAQGKVSKEVQRAYQQLNNVTHNNNDDDDDSNNDDDDTNIIKNRMSNLKKSMKFTLQKNEIKIKNLYDQATAEEMIRLKTDNSNTAPIQLMPPAIPKPASDLFDLMVNVPAPTAALSTAERQKMIVITQPSRLRNETKDINEISKYLKLAFRLVQKAELNQQNGNSVEDLKLMLSTPIPAPPTVHALEATTTKQKPVPSLATPYIITNDRDKDDLIQIKKNEAKEMLSTASNVMRALEQKIKTRTNKHQEVVQGLEASIRTSMASIDASNASWASMEREIHHGRKRHLKRQEEFRKRLSNAANDATREQIIGIYKLTNGKAPTPHNICNARHQQPMKPMAPPESSMQSHWIHTDALSGYHKCDVTETFDNTTGKKRQQFPKGDECWSARYTMQKGMEAPNVYFKASFDVPQLMYQHGNLLRASNVKVTSFPLIPIMTSVHHEAQCLDASIGQLGNQGTISVCSFGATVGLLPSTYVFDDKKQYDITDAFMKYGIFQATMLEDMPPTNTITLQGEEFCITPITAPNETDACMKCPTMRTMSKGSMKFALLGQLNSDMTNFLTMLPNGRPKYFRHVMIMDLTHGYNSNIYFNDNPSFDIEYAVTTMLDIDSLTIVDDTLEPNGNLTFSFEREFNINNRVTARLAAITLAINASNPKMLRIRFDLPLDQVREGDSFLYDPDITGGAKRTAIQLVEPEPEIDYDNDTFVETEPTNSEETGTTGATGTSNGEETGATGTATGPTSKSEPVPEILPETKLSNHRIATLTKNVAQHCSKLSVEEWCASLGSIRTCGLSIAMCHALGIDHLKNVNDIHWNLPQKMVEKTKIYQPSSDSDNAFDTKGVPGVHHGSSDCDKDCTLDIKARTHMIQKLHSTFNTWSDTQHGTNYKDFDVRKKQHRKSAILLRSLAHLLATGLQPTIGIDFKDGTHLIVYGMNEHSAAKTAGVKIGDQILSANGVEVTTVEDLATIVEAAPLSTGGALEMEVVRGGKQKLTLKVLVDDTSREDESKKERYLHV